MLPGATHTPAAAVEVEEHVLRHHSCQFLGVMEVGEHHVHVVLGRLQDLLQEGLLIVPGSQDCLLLRGQVAVTRCGFIVSLLLDDDVLLQLVVVVLFLVGREILDRVGLPQLYMPRKVDQWRAVCSQPRKSY
jgi:hypothetical protein